MKQVRSTLLCFTRNFCVDKVGILGLPFAKGQRKHGVNHGPKFMRELGLIEQLKEFVPDVMDYGDVKYKLDPTISGPPNMRNFNHVGSMCKEVSKCVERVINDGRRCVNLGGDHSIGIGTVDGHMKAKNNNVAVLWVDAHADINTHETSGSGNVHGMPLFLLSKQLMPLHPSIKGMDWLKPELSLNNLAYIGLRSVDIYEKIILEKFGVAAFYMEHINMCGIDAVVKMALQNIDLEQTRSLHVSYDIDSLDALEAPSTGTCVRGGMSLREGLRVMKVAYDTGRLNCVDLVEVNPCLGSPKDAHLTVEAAMVLIKAACGWYKNCSKEKLAIKLFPPKSY